MKIKLGILVSLSCIKLKKISIVYFIGVSHII